MQFTYHYFGDDAGLSERFEEECQCARDGDDEEDLDDNKGEREVDGIVALPDAI